MIKFAKKQSGSALLIALVMISTVTVISLAANRLYLSNSKINRLYSQTPFAYYAAESGLEEAFLAIKNDKNTTTSITASNADLKSSYAVTLSYLGDNYYLPYLNQDDYAEIDVINLQGKNIEMKWDWTSPTGEARLMAGSSASDPFAAITPDSDAVKNIAAGQEKIKISPRGQAIKNLFVKATDGSKIDSGKMTIVSAGIFQNTSRKLEAVVDRQSGSLLNIFDFAVFSQKDIN